METAFKSIPLTTKTFSTMGKYVNIMLDGGFKAVFRNKQVTIDFLNAVLAGERTILY